MYKNFLTNSTQYTQQTIYIQNAQYPQKYPQYQSYVYQKKEELSTDQKVKVGILCTFFIFFIKGCICLLDKYIDKNEFIIPDNEMARDIMDENITSGMFYDLSGNLYSLYRTQYTFIEGRFLNLKIFIRNGKDYVGIKGKFNNGIAKFVPLEKEMKKSMFNRIIE